MLEDIRPARKYFVHDLVCKARLGKSGGEMHLDERPFRNRPDCGRLSSIALHLSASAE